MKKDKSVQSNPAPKAPVQSDTGGSWIAIGLCLGILVGFLMDDLGLGMMLGVAVGLCVGPAVSVLRKNQKVEEQTSDNEKQ